MSILTDINISDFMCHIDAFWADYSKDRAQSGSALLEYLLGHRKIINKTKTEGIYLQLTFVAPDSVQPNIQKGFNIEISRPNGWHERCTRKIGTVKERTYEYFESLWTKLCYITDTQPASVYEATLRKPTHTVYVKPIKAHLNSAILDDFQYVFEITDEEYEMIIDVFKTRFEECARKHKKLQ